MKAWLEFAKVQKELWVSISKGRGDMPPFVVAERQKKPLLIAVAPQVDKYMALDAAAALRRGMACDALAVITDGYYVRGTGSGEESYRLHQAICDEYGSLQKAYLAGHKDVHEALTAMRYNPDGTMGLANMPYHREGKKVVWEEFHEIEETEAHGPDEDDEDPWTKIHDMPEEERKKLGPQVKGFIADSIRKIMKLPTLFEMPEMVAAAKMFKLDGQIDRQIYHAGRAIRKILHEKDYLLLECIPWSEEDGHGELFRKLKEKMDELTDLYDVENMKTKPEFWQKYWPSMN